VLSRTLRRRHAGEEANNRVAICVDGADAAAAAIRAGLPFPELMQRLAENGATHLSLPEWTLQTLLEEGALTPLVAAAPRTEAAPIGHWNYLHGEAPLVAALATALQKRLPHSRAAVLDGHTLSFAGSLPVIGQIGLGFDQARAAQIRAAGLGVVPRPVSYDWPDPQMLALTLADAAEAGRIVAFAGDMILGHEMHLDATVSALEEHNLTFVYFAESRHQKGDWFIAKRRAAQILLGHHFSPAEMVPLDYHAACHNWAHFARERGIRFCYVNFFRVLHATAPLEGVSYVHHLKHALEDSGFEIARELSYTPAAEPPQPGEIAAAGAVSGGVAATAVADLLDLPTAVAVPLQLAAIAGAAALPYVEEARNQAAAARYRQQQEASHHHDHHHHDHHHHDHDHDHGDLHALYPPSYAPKLIALAGTTLGPWAAANLPRTGPILQLANMAALAAVTSGPEYQLRIEGYRGFNLDWLVPLTAAALQLPNRNARLGVTAALAAGWLAARRVEPDLLSRFDPGHAEGHTHHISAAMAALGDLQMAVGPKPARKWSGLGPLLGGVSALLTRRGRPDAAAAVRLLAAAGYALGLVSFRHPERSLAETLLLAAPSLGAGTAVNTLLTFLPAKK